MRYSKSNLVFVYIIEEVVMHVHAQNAPLEWFSSTPLWAGSHAEAVERDLLVVYAVNDFCGLGHNVKSACPKQQFQNFCPFRFLYLSTSNLYTDDIYSLLRQKWAINNLDMSKKMVC